MSESSGFFISQGGDRKYTPDWLAGYIKAIITTGVFKDECCVTVADGMAVTVAPGRAWVEGYAPGGINHAPAANPRLWAGKRRKRRRNAPLQVLSL